MTAKRWHPPTIRKAWNLSPEAVTLVDAHHHLWDLEQNYYPGLSDKPDRNFFLGATDALRRNYVAQDYLRDSSGHNVLTTVHVEAEMSRDSQIGETRWLSQVNAEHEFPGAIVAAG
jgi:predicted TIM-barrel fold metal-dependent hydrolase